MAKFGLPEPFDFTHPAEWPIWQQRFSRFHVASKFDKESGEVQVNSLLYFMGEMSNQNMVQYIYKSGGSPGTTAEHASHHQASCHYNETFIIFILTPNF